MNLLPKAKRRRRAFDMTPMIDVVFQLLIFFLFTSRFTETVRTPMELPSESGDGAIDQPADIIIDVLTDGSYLVDGGSITLDGLGDRIEKALLTYGDASLLEVLVRADQQATAGSVNDVVGVLASKDVRIWRLGTAVPDPGAE